MSSALSAAAAQQTSQQLRQDIQHELTTANQLARLISNELQLIKNFTSSGGEFEQNIKKKVERSNCVACGSRPGDNLQFQTYIAISLANLAMSSALSAAAAQQTSQQLRQDIQHELTTANQLARLISNELQLIKNFTSSGGEFEQNIKKNASLISALADTYHINMENIPTLVRKPIDQNTHQNQNKSDEDHNNFRNESEMDDLQ